MDVGAVREQDLAEIPRALRGHDGPAEAVADEGRQVAGVIHVGVGEDDCVERGGVKWKGLPVALP